MDYSGMILLAAFIIAIQLATRANAHPVFSTSVAVVLPYTITLILKYIYATSYKLPIIPNLFSLSDVITVIVQFIIGMYVFKRIRDEDGLAATVIWGIGGYFLIIILVPYLFRLVHI